MRRIALLFFAAVLLAGCRDTNAPIHGTHYVLRSIDGRQLPAPYTENVQLNNRMFADTLILSVNRHLIFPT